MSIVALSPYSSRTIPGLKAVVKLGKLNLERPDDWIRAGKDRRVLQMLPDNLLADMGLEKIEVRSGNDTADARSG